MAEFTGRVGHLEGIESPWANGGGVVKTVEDVEAMARTGVGWIEDGSHCLEDRLGNGWNPETRQRDKKDWDYNPETGEMHNSLGMPGQGIDKEERDIPEKVRITHAHRKAFVLNVAPVSDKPAEESLELISRGYAAGADGVLLNAGCPNVYDEEGNPHEILSRSPADFGHVLTYLAEASLPKPIWVRISPQDSPEAMRSVAELIARSGIVSAVLVPNTWTVPMPTRSDGQPLLDVAVPRVGKSGPAMAKAARMQAAWAITYLNAERKKVDVIQSSGIMNGHELRAAIGMGAVAGCGTTRYYHSENGWSADTDKLLSAFAA